MSGIRRLKSYYPNSENYWKDPSLTYSAANQYPAQVNRLAEAYGVADHHEPTRLTASEFNPDEINATELADLFKSFGSDKSSPDDYHMIYGKILGELGPQNNLTVLEIGIGTNDPRLVSTMGRTGRPGASLRALRDFLPHADVYGADIDSRILFSEDRIQTAVVDQTDLGSFQLMTQSLDCDRFDLIIDDGLHSPEANLNTMLFASRALNPAGWVVIEDIPERTVNVWKLIGRVLPEERLQCFLVRCRVSYAFVARRVGE